MSTTDAASTSAITRAGMSEDQFTVLMGAIGASKSTLEGALDAKFEEFRKEVQTGQVESLERVAKRARIEKPYSFRYKGNEDQFYFNEKVVDTMDQSEVELEKAVSDPTVKTVAKLSDVLDRAQKAVKEGKELLQQRQKHIKLADRSDHGWKVVQEYEADDLANDSSDEKRILKAEKAAEAKAVAASKKKSNRPSKSSYTPRTNTTWSNYRPGQQSQQYQRSRTGGPSSGGPSGYKPLIGPCHGCHEMGHLKKDCLKTRQYPLDLACASECSVNESGGNCKDSVNLQPIDVEFDEESEVLTPRYWEAEHACISVKGRLKESFEFWANELRATKPVLDIVQQGYYLPLMHVPDIYCRPNHRSAFMNVSFVDSAVHDLLQNHCVRSVDNKPHVCSPLIVVESSSGKKRLVINLRYLNMFLWKVKFKYEDMRTALMYFEKGDFLCTFDLKSGYHHVDIHVDSQNYLGFEWRDRHYVFTVLPFGLATACYVFTKLLRPVVRYLRAKGIRIVVYIDDGIAVGADFEQTKAISESIEMTLSNAGFVLNQEKSKLYPSKCVRWLGFDVNLDKGHILVPPDKILKLKVILAHAMEADSLPAKVVASITGKIISLGLAIGSIARLRTRALYTLLHTRQSWGDVLILSEEAKAEVSFWLKNLQQFNGQPIWRSPSALRVVYSDASDTGFGGYTVEHGGLVVNGQWTVQEAMESSTWRELKAVAEILESVASKLRNHRVRWFTDNQNVVRIIQVGSRKQNLQLEAVRIFRLSIDFSIKLEPEWIPREHNEIADYLSRIIDYDDWGINQTVFSLIDRKWGPHTVDRFASKHNTKLVRFNSRYLDYCSEAVDAFTVDWNAENNYFCPPVYLVPRVLHHARACKCKGTLVVPEWPSAVFWPLLCSSEKGFDKFVVDSICLPLGPNLIVKGKAGANLFKDGTPTTNVLALRLKFSEC